MEIYIVRHCDPDYDTDSLTPQGIKEAQTLSGRIKDINADAFYCSPMGRAQKTASIALDSINANPETLDWLHEFFGFIEYRGQKQICWDLHPSYWTKENKFYTDKWMESDLLNDTNVKDEYIKVTSGIDELLSSYGYIHEDKIFRVKQGNHKKIVLFCHFGVQCIILGYLLNLPPMVLLHNFAALPSSVTKLVTEEREKGIANFRLLYFGDLSHLYENKTEPSFAARFCECYEDETRH